MGLSVENLIERNDDQRTNTNLLGQADIRFYVAKKNAPFFKDKGFAAWTATAVLKAKDPGIYGLEELQVKSGKEAVTEGLWGFKIQKKIGKTGECFVLIDNYIKGKEFDFTGTKVAGYEASIPIPANGSYSLTSGGISPITFWKAELSVSPAVGDIGDIGPAGGLIFYDKGSMSDGWRYLEAAPSDQSTGIQWYNGKKFDTGATATGIGSGRANTSTIVSKQGTGNYAAALCDKLVLGGFDDWFLPSMDEINLMYTNLKKPGKGGFESAWYWSSSEYDSSYAWRQGFDDGGQGYSGKGYINYSVRAVRAF